MGNEAKQAFWNTSWGNLYFGDEGDFNNFGEIPDFIHERSREEWFAHAKENNGLLPDGSIVYVTAVENEKTFTFSGFGVVAMVRVMDLQARPDQPQHYDLFWGFGMEDHQSAVLGADLLNRHLNDQLYRLARHLKTIATPADESAAESLSVLYHDLMNAVPIPKPAKQRRRGLVFGR